MDQITRKWYGMEMEVRLRSYSEQAYEDFFCDVMFAKYSDNFQYVKAAGSDGDGKADGYLAPEKQVYQCYAPSSGFNKAKLINKIEGDFIGAKEKWGERMAKWTFCHNSFEGLPPYALEKIDELKNVHKDIVITQSWGPQKIKEKAMEIPIERLVDLLGVAPTQQDFNSITHETINMLLKAISKKTYENDKVIEPVSVNKLQFNKLSEDVAGLLNLGRQKEKFVAELLGRWPDPEYGEELADSFRKRYQEAIEENLSPDQIFRVLKTFAGGDSGEIAQQSASLAVLSYFFERCDIFENAPDGWSL